MKWRDFLSFKKFYNYNNSIMSWDHCFFSLFYSGHRAPYKTQKDWQHPYLAQMTFCNTLRSKKKTKKHKNKIQYLEEPLTPLYCNLVFRGTPDGINWLRFLEINNSSRHNFYLFFISGIEWKNKVITLKIVTREKTKL